jgi:hypothetical protein
MRIGGERGGKGLTDDDPIPSSPFDIMQNSINPMSSIRDNDTFLSLSTDDSSALLPDIIQERQPISLHESVGVTFNLDSKFLFGDGYGTGDGSV